MSNRSRIPWLLCTALAPLLMAGSCRPELVEVATFPALVCPGDVIELRLVAKNYEGGRLEASPAPVDPGFPVSIPGSEPLRAESRDVQICESTVFRALIWNGDEVACGDKYTECGETFASVMTGDEVQTRRLSPCGGTTPGQVTLTLEERRFSDSIQVRDVANCGERTVVLTHAGSSDRLDPGGPPSGSFSGDGWVGDWTATESIVPPEGCPPPGLVTPLPPPPAPPEICLRFTVGCASTTECG